MFRRRRKLTEAETAERAARKLAHASVQRECQICERRQCLSPKALLVLHGYERPGYGFIQGSCFGVGFVDYSRGTDALVLYRASLMRMLDEAKTALQAYVDKRVVHFTTLHFTTMLDERGYAIYVGRKAQTQPRLLDWSPFVSDREQYEQHLATKHTEAATRVAQLESEIARVERRIAAFVPPPSSSPSPGAP